MRYWMVLLGACTGGTPDDTLETDPPEVTESTADTAPGPWRSALYPDDWTPGTTVDGLYLPDFSYAGYREGAPLPVLPEPEVRLDAEPGDATARIQAAVDGLVDGGTVRLSAGDWQVDGRITIRTDGVVIAGDGPATRLFLTSTGTGASAIRFLGETAASADETLLLADAEPRSVRLEVAEHDLAVGDAIAVGAVITDAFREAHGMSSRWGFAAGAWRTFFRRTVTAVGDGYVEIDVPIRYPLRTTDGASIRRDDGYLTEVGLADLALTTAIDRELALASDRHHAVAFDRVRDGWARGVVSFDPGVGAHLQSSGFYVVRSRRVTIADSELGRPQHRGEGGNGYLYELSQSSDVLIRDCVAREGRHNFIVNWDFSTNGSVFLRTLSDGGRAENGPVTITGMSEFHHALAMANLIDSSVTHDGWQSKNRHDFSSGAGHAGTGNVFWNTSGTGELWSMQYDLGFVIGTAPELTVHTALDTLDLTFGALATEPEDYGEGIGLGALLEPSSLYEDQRARRLR